MRQKETLSFCLCSSSGSLASPEGDSDAEAGQQQVGHHADDGQRCHSNEAQQGCSECCCRLLWLFPMNKLEDYGGTEGRSANDFTKNDLNTSETRPYSFLSVRVIFGFDQTQQTNIHQISYSDE